MLTRSLFIAYQIQIITPQIIGSEFVVTANDRAFVCHFDSRFRMAYPVTVMQKHKEKSNEIEVSDGDPSKIQEIQNLVFLTPKQAAIYLQLSPKTIWSHTRRGLLPYFRIGGLIRYRRHALDEALIKLETRSTARK